jgi:hypothetical protein
VKAFELGYRSLISKISVDINGYYNIYNDFIGNLTVAAPYYGCTDAPNDTQSLMIRIPDKGIARW